MRTRLLTWYRQLKGSYWFVPGLFAFLAIMLALGTLQLDRLFGDELDSMFNGIGSSSPPGARAILTTIGGSMVSVAGIIFSITIAAVVFASGQYGPHIIPAFMRDRANQVTLGVFIATFIYCMLALYRVQAGEQTFVPHLTIIIALFFAAGSLVTFIFFIHHILETLHVSNIIAGLGHELIAGMKARFPGEMGTVEEERSQQFELPEGFLEDAVPVRADGVGYLHTLSANSIFRTAVDKGVIIRMVRRPGDFVADGRPLAWVWPPENATEETLNYIRSCFAWGAQKTPDQDIAFLIEQMTGITSRALSPGINDPHTAIDTVHWMGAALAAAGRGVPPSPVRRDEDNNIRVIAHAYTFEEMADLVFNDIRPYVGADRNASLAALSTLSDLLFDLNNADHRRCVISHVRLLGEACAESLPNEADRRAVAARIADLEACYRNGIDRFRAGERYQWLEGRA